MAETVDHALEYAARGWPVFPCSPVNKRPYTGTGFKAASTDPDQIRAWWAQSPKAMVAVPTGAETGFWVLDLDREGDKDGVATIAAHGELPATLEQSTPRGGRHLFFRFHESRPVTSRAGKVGPGVDTRGGGGYVIMPGSRRMDGAAYAWVGDPATPIAEAPDWLYELIERRPEPPPRPTAPRRAPTVTAGAPYVRKAVEAEVSQVLTAPKGARNDTLNVAAFNLGQLVGSGNLGEDEARSALLGAAEESGYVAEDGQHQALATVRSGLAAGMLKPRDVPDREAQSSGVDVTPFLRQAAALASGPRLVEATSWRTFTADQLEGLDIPPRIWHAPGLIPGRTVTQLSGDGGVGKSTLALQLACATAAELPWLGQDPRAGRALYLSAEDDRDELHRRLDQIAVFYGVGFEAFAGLMLWALADDDALFATGAPGKPLETTKRWIEFAEIVADWRPSLIVLDSLADFYGGNENDRGQVRQFIRLLRGVAIAADAAIVLLAHPSLTGISSGSGLSGSTAWNNSVRSRLYLSTPAKEDGSTSAPNIRTLGVMKANYAQSGTEMKLRLSAGAFVNEDLGASSMLDLATAADRVDHQFLALLDAFDTEGRRLSHRKGPGYAPAEFGKDPRAQGTTKKGFEAAMARLFAAGEIRVVTTGPASRQTSRVVRSSAIEPSNTPSNIE